MMTKEVLLKLYDIERLGTPVFKNNKTKHTIKHYVENRILSHCEVNELMLIKNSAGKNDYNIYSIIEKLTPTELNQIEKDFVNTLFFTEDIYFFKKYCVPLFNPSSKDIKKFLFFYFNSILDRIKSGTYSYSKSVLFFNSFANNLAIFNYEEDKKAFAFYCIKVLLSTISNSLWEYSILSWKNKLYFNEIDLIMHIIYPENTKLFEKEMLEPLMLSKLSVITSKEIDIFNQFIASDEYYFGNMKDIVFSILLELPSFRKQYIEKRIG